MPLSLSVEQDRTRQRLLAGNLILASLSVFYNNLKIILLGFLKALRIFPILSLCIDTPWMLYMQWALHRAHKKGLISKAEYGVAASVDAVSGLMVNIAMVGQVISAVALGLAGPILFIGAYGISTIYALIKWIVHYKTYQREKSSYSAPECQLHVKQLKVEAGLFFAYLGATIALGLLLLHPIGIMVSGAIFVVFNLVNLGLNWVRPIAVLKKAEVASPESFMRLSTPTPALLSQPCSDSQKEALEMKVIPSILALRSLRPSCQ